MLNADEIFDKLKEIDTQIRERINQDGSCKFDPECVMVSLELARRMVVGEDLPD